MENITEQPKHITLEQILTTVRESEQESWDLNDCFECPAAITGKNLYGDSFRMWDFNTGFFENENEEIIVTVDQQWANWTTTKSFGRTYAFVTKEFILESFGG